jgi:hypothetical protein
MASGSIVFSITRRWEGPASRTAFSRATLNMRP